MKKSRSFPILLLLFFLLPACTWFDRETVYTSRTPTKQAEPSSAEQPGKDQKKKEDE